MKRIYLISTRDEEIVSTSGGTEADNFVLKDVAFANESKGRHIAESTRKDSRHE